MTPTLSRYNHLKTLPKLIFENHIMAEFIADWQSLRPSSFPFLDIDNMELLNHLKGVNSHTLDNSILNMQNLMQFSSDSFFCSSEPEFQGNLEENLPGLVHHFNQNEAPVSPPISSVENEGRKRKATNMSGPSSANSTPAVSESESKIKNCSGRGKRVKKNMMEEEDKKSTQVVHVRARRGQATDSHSLAERVRRGKINEKLKCLQNIVPGCYKTMGMAIMLDEIINYVQSLQHQVEFLSMKLTAASTFYDFNSEIDSLEAMQRARVSEAKELAKYVTEGYEGVSCFQPTWP